MISVGYNPARESLDIDQFQVQRSCNTIEDRQPLAQNHRMSNQMVFVYKPRRYQAPHKSGTPAAAIGFPCSDLSSLIPSARSPSKTCASAQEAAAGDCSALGKMPPLNLFLVKSALGISFIGAANGPVAVGQ
jgi:hypothetical protein